MPYPSASRRPNLVRRSLYLSMPTTKAKLFGLSGKRHSVYPHQNGDRRNALFARFRRLGRDWLAPIRELGEYTLGFPKGRSGSWPRPEIPRRFRSILPLMEPWRGLLARIVFSH